MDDGEVGEGFGDAVGAGAELAGKDAEVAAGEFGGLAERLEVG